MKIVYVSPTYFDESSVIGGGERYPVELAAWMAKSTQTTLVSFSTRRSSYRRDDLKFEIYPVKHFIHGNKINPLSFQYLTPIFKADIVHIHFMNTLVSDMGCLLAFLLNKRVFVTDHGGGGSLVLNHKLPVFSCYKNAIAQSHFAINCLPDLLQQKAVLIKGGIDTDRFCPNHTPKVANKILYVGRILPHKGINYLIKALQTIGQTNYKLIILGRVYSEEFYQDLKQLASGLPIEFVHDADDQRLLDEYRSASVTVLPSVHKNCYGGYTAVPELMGFTLLESQACGTPVICTDAGAMHEFVEDGRTGFVVQQNSEEAIATALHKIMNLSASERLEFQQRCVTWAKSLNWSTVVQKHLELYKSAL